MFKLMRFALGLFISAVAFIQSSAIAAPPEFVYRMDTRSPDQIFTYGFSSWGSNDNVFAHTSGYSCVEVDFNQRNSAFISTSADLGWARTQALIYSLTFPNQNIYLYRIRANDYFYNAVESLNFYGENTPGVRITDLNRIPARNATEYLAFRRIEPGSIAGATMFNNGASSERPNPGYIHSDTHANNIPYGGSSDNTFNRLTWVSFLPFVGACFGDLGGDKRATHKSYVITLESIAVPALE